MPSYFCVVLSRRFLSPTAPLYIRLFLKVGGAIQADFFFARVPFPRGRDTLTAWATPPFVFSLCPCSSLHVVELGLFSPPSSSPFCKHRSRHLAYHVFFDASEVLSFFFF